MECMKGVRCDGAVIVTTPQEVSLEDVRKELTFCNKTGIKVLGIVENMSGFVCPDCAHCTNIFSSGGGEALAQVAQVPHLGTLPIDPRISLNGGGKSFMAEYPEATTSTVLRQIVAQLVSK